MNGTDQGKTARRIRVMVVDDHPILRGGLRKLLELESDLEVVGEAGTGQEALAQIARHSLDVLLLDINLPDISGFEVVESLRRAGSRLPVVLLTAYDDQDQAYRAMQLGASAYCNKAIEPDKLFATIRAVTFGRRAINGEQFTAEQMSAWLVANAPGGSEHLAREPRLPLSAREMEVLRCVTRGMSNKAIAHQLGISHQTVRNHMTSILYKLNVEGRTQAAVYAIKHGWVRAEDYRPLIEE